MGGRLDAIVVPGEQAERVRYPTDEIWLRLVGHGDVQVADYMSVERDGPPAHSHPWDELQILVDGIAEFRIGAGDWVAGGSGTVQALPAGVAHAIRVPEGSARITQISIGAPYDGFAREMARLFGTGRPARGRRRGGGRVRRQAGLTPRSPTGRDWRDSAARRD